MDPGYTAGARFQRSSLPGFLHSFVRIGRSDEFSRKQMGARELHTEKVVRSLKSVYLDPYTLAHYHCCVSSNTESDNLVFVLPLFHLNY